MSRPVSIRKTDLIRAAQVSNETGCKIEIKTMGMTYIVHPEKDEPAPDTSRVRVDFTPPVL